VRVGEGEYIVLNNFQRRQSLLLASVVSLISVKTWHTTKAHLFRSPPMEGVVVQERPP
jgi:hypothetical protein